MTESRSHENPRILCLHGFRNSAKILETEIHKWPESVLEKLDLVYLDGPYPSTGKSGVEGIFDPPYFEWFQGNQDYTEYENFEECITFIEDFMVKNGPFDGFLGFSQGAVLAAALPGMQAEGLVLTKVPKIKSLILISGAKFGGSKLGAPPLAANAFSSPVKCPSLHVIGGKDSFAAHASRVYM
ncbi:esterase FUS5-like isoform X2 [Rhodamnia argentea]|uniref:Esterase FUS5-like isoform X2 n=1 Tax=Rhodamnia argentea TaxID=178133 RepID=A0ABM3GY03_9MYRT|nr:esterase FUS5-like isoform X2 [Rhodamnia argentea]